MMTRLAILLGSGWMAWAASLSVQILDEHGRATAARVYLTDARGQAVFAPDTIRYDKVRPEGTAEQHFVPREGKFTVELPAGEYRLTVERGKEYEPEEQRLIAPPAGQMQRTVRLRRWVQMADRGWYSADMYVHRSLAEVPALMEAEGLAVALPITRWRANQTFHEDPALAEALGRADQNGVITLGQGRFFPVLNEELEPRGSALLASGLGRTGVALAYPLAAFGQAVHQAGGMADAEKATSLEFPALAAVGAFQTVGLVNNHLWRAGAYAAPWGAWPDQMLGTYPRTCEGFVQAGFDLYAALLNLGLPVTMSAGSASGVHPVPPGWSRVYVHPVGALTPAFWAEAVRAGRSFVTTGPMLLLQVNGQSPGEALQPSRFPAALHIEVEVLSREPIPQVEVVVNGEVHPVALRRGAGVSARGSLEVTAATTSWVAARWIGARGPACDAAHTAPLHVRNGNAPPPVRLAEVEKLLARVEALIARVRQKENTGLIMADSDELRQQTLTYLEQARAFYQRQRATR